MNITFMNPLFLLGLAAGVLPILIHRITRRKVSVRSFSAVRLLLQSQRITAKPQRLKHLLLMALRILAVLIIVFMMARPVFVRSGFAAFRGGGATVVILDNSLSMGFREDRGQRYESAKKAAKEALEDIGGRVVIIPTAGARELSWVSPETAQNELDAVPLTFQQGDPAAAFASAYRQVKDLKLPKQILVFSDMARSDWEHLDLTGFETVSDADVVFFRIGGPGRDANFRIKAVRPAQGDIVAGVPTRLLVTVSNLSLQPAVLLVELSLAGRKIDRKSIDLQSGQDQTVPFDIRVDTADWLDGEVKLASDRLPFDDVFYFSLKAREKIKVLVVDGDPKTHLAASESHYLVGALRPGEGEGSPFFTRVITESEMSWVDLRSYDVLFLLNVADPDFSRPAAFLDTGRPVFLFLGNRIVPEAYNRSAIAPWRILERIDLGARDGKTVRIDPIREPLDFLKPLEASLKRASFGTYFRIEWTARPLLSFENLDPLLLEADSGRSKIFLFASSADLEWNDLPLTAAFLPLIQELVSRAVGSPEASFSKERLRQRVNPPPEESDLAKIAEDELKKKFGSMKVDILEYKENGIKALRGGSRTLWPGLLMFLLTVLAVEMILANSFQRSGGGR